MALPGLVAAKNLADVIDRERAWDNLGQGFTATFDTLPLDLALGTPLEGGYFAGYISHTADGSPTHALIVAPRATGATGTGYTLTTNLQWAANASAPDGVNYSTTLVGGSFTGSITGTTMTVTAVASGKIRPGHTITGTTVALGTVVVSQDSGATNGVGDYTVSVSQTVTSRALTAGISDFDGAANAIMFKDIDSAVGSGSTIFPAANFCQALSIGGFTDWYWPSRFEMDIAYFNLKPDTANNVTTFGSNNYSVPKRTANYTLTYPQQTYVTAFNTSAEGFVNSSHFCSTESNFANGITITFLSGGIGSGGSATKVSTNHRVRAFRRIAL